MLAKLSSALTRALHARARAPLSNATSQLPTSQHKQCWRWWSLEVDGMLEDGGGGGDGGYGRRLQLIVSRSWMIEPDAPIG